MKKAFLSVFLAVILLAIAVLPAYAAEAEPVTVQNADGSLVTYFADGSYLTVSAIYVADDQISTLATTKSGSKNVTYTDTDGNLEWKYTLSATFSYTSGVSSKCTNVSYSKTIYASGWSFSNGSTALLENTAYGYGTFTYKVLFVTMKTCDIDISITCDKYGNLS